MIAKKFNNNGRIIQLILIFGLLGLVLLRDTAYLNLPINSLTMYCLVILFFLDNTELIALGLIMVVYNHALQINYILLAISALLIFKNFKQFRYIKFSSLLLFLIIICEAFHALSTSSQLYDFEFFLRWLCMPLFMALAINAEEVDYIIVLKIFSFSVIFAGLDIAMQVMKYEGGALVGLLTSRYRFGNVFLYNNTIHYSMYDNENNIGFFALAGILSSLVLLEKTKNKKYLIVTALQLIIGLLTQSRAFILSLFSIILVFLFKSLAHSRITAKKIGYAGIVTTILVLMIFIFREPLQIIINNINARFASTNFSSDRGDLFLGYLNYWMSDLVTFIFGIGTQNINIITGISNTTHNGLIDILICFGLIGLIIIGLFWFNVIRETKIQIRSSWIKAAAILAFFLEYNTLQYVRVPALFGLSLVLYGILKADLSSVIKNVS